MLKKLTQHLKHLLRPKKTPKFQEAWKDKYKWLRFDEKENKMFCEFCREFSNRNEKI